MRGVSRYRCGVGVRRGLARGGAPCVAQEQREPGAGPTRDAARAAGATIRAIHIIVDNVFDPNNPEEDKALYRWANRVHVRTRTSVIEDILLFAPGDTFVARLLDESARALRARGFIAEATVEPGSYDAATNSVDVNVRVRDSWSLALDLKLNRNGGETEWGIGLSDNNLFGTGKTLEVSLRERDRSRRDGARLRRRQRVRQPRAAAGAVRATRATAIGASSASNGRSSRSTRAGRSAARFTTSSASTRCTTSARRSTSSGTTSTRSTLQGGWSRGARRAARAALAVRRHVRGAHVPRRRPTCRSRCCCRRTASSSIRGSAGSASRTTTGR